MNKEIYKDLDNLYESIESLNNKIKRQERELELTYKGIEQLNNIIHKAIEYIEEQTLDVEMNIYGMPPTIKLFRGNTERLLKKLKGEDKE